MNPNPPKLPAAKGIGNFLMYAPFLGVALRSYPLAVSFPCTDKSPNTYAVCTRNVREGKKLAGFSSPDIDEELFAQHADKLAFCVGIGCFYIGTKEAIAALKAKDEGKVVAVAKSSAAATNEIEVEDRGENLLCLCRILSIKGFNPVPIFLVTTTSEKVALYTKTLDVEFIPIEGRPNTYRVI